MTRYLTKSIFKQALTCPTKLYYATNREYVNKNIEDSFLQSLAEGGFQVGALATCYIPGGVMIETLDIEAAVSKTTKLLEQDQVIIYEAAIRFDNLLVRVDILKKDGNQLELIEVKAKSFNPNRDSFYTKKGGLKSAWKEYLEDIAFQKHVVIQAYPDSYVSANLMVVDKSARCPVSGLNQKFRLTKDDRGRTQVTILDLVNDEDLATPILIKLNVEEACRIIYDTKYRINQENLDYHGRISYLATQLKTNTKIATGLGQKCGDCEFRCGLDQIDANHLSGYHECFKEQLGWSDEDFNDQTVLELWNFRYKDRFFQEGLIKLKDIEAEDLGVEAFDGSSLTTSQRQWLQIEKVKTNDKSPWLNKERIKAEMDHWKFPLHFIDFETSAVAIPFTKGRHPYEAIAFQFSHHVIYQDGTIEHRGEYLNATPGFFPNYEFVRELKKQLETDQGTIFRYAAHENTYLNFIYSQLQRDKTVPDREELSAFIKTITKSSGSSNGSWEGERNMVDLCVVIKKYYYDPFTKGSNSIKYVLPAILNSSAYLQTKYAQPIYGAVGGIKSLNYQDKIWVEFDGDQVIDPYQLLPSMFEDIDPEELELLVDNDRLQNGGAALIAYARMQFEQMSAIERTQIEQALLRYCELDTLAMVMIYEGLKDLIGK